MAAGDQLFLTNAAVFLGAAVVAVPLFKRLKLGSVLGYLAAGAVIGPAALGLIQSPQTVLGVAEFGVVLLLFVIGLELKPGRLWRLRSDIFGLGSLQVLVTGAAIAGLVLWLGYPVPTAVMTGAALALSSTAFAVQILREKEQLASPYGDRTFSILLFQDLAIVPLLALAALLAPIKAGEGVSLAAVGIAVGAVAGLVLLLRYGLPPVFELVARTRSNELFTASALLVVVGSALVMDHVGLSMALGAFLAGLLLAESAFRHQLETDIEPFRGLLLGLFFMAFGMKLDWRLVAANWWIVLLGALGLYLLKVAILFALSRLFGSGSRDALRIGAVAGQGGEFAFVIVSVSAGSGLMTGDLPALLSAIVTISMALTPFAVALAERLPEEGHSESADGLPGVAEAAKARVLIAGFGRVGQVIARILSLRGYSITLIDNSPRRIRMAGQFGNRVYYGDATRPDVLASAGAAEADIIFLCIDDRDGARTAVEKLRERFPDTLIFVDTYDRFTEVEMWEAGADHVVRETRESAIALAREALVRLGDGSVADEVIEEYRRLDAERLRAQTADRSEKALEKMRQAYQVDVAKD
jgi:monovalent cation:proton antiporter-2 (CPA2) family protein